MSESVSAANCDAPKPKAEPPCGLGKARPE